MAARSLAIRRTSDTGTVVGSLLLAPAAGAVSLLAFAPYGWYPLALAGPAVLFLLWCRATPGLAFLQGWLGAMGLLLPGTFWLHLTGLRMNTVEAEAAMLMTIGFLGLIALVFGAAGFLFAWSARHLTGAWLSLRPLSLAASWVLADWLRGRPSGGFPAWLSLGYSQIDGPLAGFAPIVGLHGVTFLLVLSAGLLVAGSWASLRTRLPVVAAIWAAGAALQPLAWSEAAGPPLRATLLQGSLFEGRAWTNTLIDEVAASLAATSRAALATADLVVWPESALGSADLSRIESDVLRPLETELADVGKYIVLNAFEYVAPLHIRFSRVVALGTSDRAHYDKRILVPVGEFMPRGPLLDQLWQAMGLFHGGNLRHGPPNAPILPLGGYVAGVAVCYEIGFGDLVRSALPEAAFLVNLSNDSWFDGSLGPEQHLQIARMRAAETRRWLLRATLTGHTAIIDPHGRIAARLPTNAAATLTADIVPRQGRTIYARFGDWPVLASSFLFLAVALGCPGIPTITAGGRVGTCRQPGVDSGSWTPASTHRSPRLLPPRS